MEEEIFRVEVNETGYYWIRRFHTLAIVILVGTLLLGGANTITTIVYVLKANRYSYAMHWRNLGFVSYFVFIFLLQAIQVIFYKRFAAHCRKAIEGSDSIVFNLSFRWLYFQAVCFFSQIVATFLYFVITYFLYRF